MMRSLLVVLVCATPLLSDSREEATLSRTLESLQGDWTVKSMTIAGQRLDSVEPTGYRIAGDLMIETANPEEAVRLNLDVSNGIPMVRTLDRYGDTRTGVMQRSGDTIQMCWVKNGHRDEPPPAPTTFKSTETNKAVLMVLVPAKK